MSWQPTQGLLRYFMKTADDARNKFSPLPKLGVAVVVVVGFIK